MPQRTIQNAPDLRELDLPGEGERQQANEFGKHVQGQKIISLWRIVKQGGWVESSQAGRWGREVPFHLESSRKISLRRWHLCQILRDSGQIYAWHRKTL